MHPSTNAVDAGCYLRLLANWGLGLAGVPLVIASEADQDPDTDPPAGPGAAPGAKQGLVAAAAVGLGPR